MKRGKKDPAVSGEESDDDIPLGKRLKQCHKESEYDQEYDEESDAESQGECDGESEEESAAESNEGSQYDSGSDVEEVKKRKIHYFNFHNLERDCQHSEKEKIFISLCKFMSIPQWYELRFKKLYGLMFDATKDLEVPEEGDCDDVDDKVLRVLENWPSTCKDLGMSDLESAMVYCRILHYIHGIPEELANKSLEKAGEYESDLHRESAEELWTPRVEWFENYCEQEFCFENMDTFRELIDNIGGFADPE